MTERCKANPCCGEHYGKCEVPLPQHRSGLWFHNTAEYRDNYAVDQFAEAMKAKLAKKRAEGRGGWDRKDECSKEFLSQLLRDHIGKGDPVDVANFCMMLQQRGERISSPGKDGGQEVEAVGEQWRALEDGSPKTSWCPVGYGDEAGWRAIANRHPDKYQVESRPVFARPSQRTVDAGVVCAARRQGTAGGNDPADCNWPFCGCDPHADKVIAALQECGWCAPQPIIDVGAVKIVPVEPTAAMIDAANESEASWKSIWPAMLAAAPVPPSSLAWDGQTVEALIEQYANGAYVARNSEPPISIYRAHFKEFVEKLRPVLSPQAASKALVKRRIAEIVAANVQSVCDWDDRTSPEDYPDHLMITPAELTELLEGVVDAALSASQSTSRKEESR